MRRFRWIAWLGAVLLLSWLAWPGRSETRRPAPPERRGEPGAEAPAARPPAPSSPSVGARIAAESGPGGPGGSGGPADRTPSGSLVRVHVRAPVDGKFHVLLRREGGPVRGSWLLPSADGSYRRPGVAPGTYRIFEVLTRTLSEPIRVERDVDIDVPFDLSRAGEVTGTVRVPAGEDAGPAHVLVIGEGIEPPEVTRWPPGKTNVRPDGTFRVRIPGDRPVTLRPTHPSLIPGESGEVELVSPEAGITLELVHSGRCVVQFPSAPAPSLLVKPRVLLFPGEPEGTPLSVRDLEIDGETGSFSGFEPGTCTLWLEVPGYAPLVLRNVNLGRGETDLGRHSLSRGSSLRFRIRGKEGRSPPALSFAAIRIGSPTYTRWTSSRAGHAKAVLAGLGPGRFRVTSNPIDAEGGTVTRTVTVDGESDLDVEWNLGK